MAAWVKTEFVKQWADIRENDDDGLIGTLCQNVTEVAKKYIERDLLTNTYTGVFDGTGSSRLMLPQYPVTAVSSVVVDNVPISAYSASAGLGFKVTNFSVVLIGSTFTQGIQNVEVAWTAGLATVPLDLQQALAETVLLRLREPKRNDVASLSVAGTTTTFRSSDIPVFARKVLERYRKRIPV